MFNVLLAFAAGFVASIFAWPWLRAKVGGLEAEADRLRAKARALDKKIMGGK